MPNRWPGCVKIHEGCGGVVRWVEAIDRPGVGYHGECLRCNADEIVVEHIIPLEVPEDVQDGDRWILEMDSDELAELRWDDEEDWESNQEELQGMVA